MKIRFKYDFKIFYYKFCFIVFVFNEYKSSEF